MELFDFLDNLFTKEIDVTSKEGKGTIFNIRLPYLR